MKKLIIPILVAALGVVLFGASYLFSSGDGKFRR